MTIVMNNDRSPENLAGNNFVGFMVFPYFCSPKKFFLMLFSFGC